MKRRICLVGATLAAGSLMAGMAIDSAATAKVVKKKSQTPVVVTVTCSTAVTTEIPAGETQFTPPATQGTDYGTVKCGGRRFPQGVQSDTWTVPDSGDTVGSYRQYFNQGTIHGGFDLTPTESQTPTQDNIAATDYTGTVTVTGGTGVYTGVKGTGTSTCSSPDDIHLRCLVKLKLKLPVNAGK